MHVFQSLSGLLPASNYRNLGKKVLFPSVLKLSFLGSVTVWLRFCSVLFLFIAHFSCTIEPKVWKGWESSLSPLVELLLDHFWHGCPWIVPEMGGSLSGACPNADLPTLLVRGTEIHLSGSVVSIPSTSASWRCPVCQDPTRDAI